LSERVTAHRQPGVGLRLKVAFLNDFILIQLLQRAFEMSTEDAPASDLVPLHTDLLLEVTTVIAGDQQVPLRWGAEQGYYLLTVLQLTLFAVQEAQWNGGGKTPSRYLEVKARLVSAAVAFALSMAKLAQRYFHSSKRGADCLEQAINVLDMVHRGQSHDDDTKIAILTALGSHPCPSFAQFTISKELQARLHMLVFEDTSKSKGEGRLDVCSSSGHSDVKGDRKVPTMVLRDSLVAIDSMVSPYEDAPPLPPPLLSRKGGRGANASPGPGQSNPFLVHRCGARLVELCVALLQSPENCAFFSRAGGGAEGSNRNKKAHHMGRGMKKVSSAGGHTWDEDSVAQMLRNDSSASSYMALLAFIGKLFWAAGSRLLDKIIKPLV